MSIVPQTPPQGFQLVLPEGTFTVENVNAPLWHGKYQKGLLSIYQAIPSTSINIAATAIVSVYSQDLEGNEYAEDFVVVSYYVTGTSNEEIVQDIQDKIFDQYCSVKASNAIKTAVASSKNSTLH